MGVIYSTESRNNSGVISSHNDVEENGHIENSVFTVNITVVFAVISIMMFIIVANSIFVAKLAKQSSESETQAQSNENRSNESAV